MSDRPESKQRDRKLGMDRDVTDAAASTHTDSAIDEAHRAAREQLIVRSRARRN